jgi:S1-C subfamily serine protease
MNEYGDQQPEQPAPSGQWAAEQPAPSGQWAAEQPAPSGQWAAEQPAPSAQSAAEQPAPSAQCAAEQPAPSAQWAAEQPAPSAQWAGEQPAPSAQWAAEQPAPSAQWAAEQPAPQWWQAPAPPPPAAQQPAPPAWQPRRSPRSVLTRQWPTPVVAAVAAVLGAVSMLTFHAAIANADNGTQTAPTSVTAPQFGNGQHAGNGAADGSGLTFPRWRFGDGSGNAFGQFDPFSALQQDLQGLLQGNGRRAGGSSSGRTATNTAATAISPAIVDINIKLVDGEGAGTGIVLTPDGEVLTNNHVIAGATAISATDVGNGKTYRAVVVGYDKANDVAVLQLQNASGLTTAKIAPNPAKVGDAVVGVGNAEGLGGTPSWAAGTVTALNRSITATAEDGSSPENVSGMMQTTTPIEPGDSGGPLVNAAGEVVGMDTAGEFSALNSAASSAYAIPIAKALSIADQIRRGDSSNGVHIGETPMLGVMIRADRAFGGANGVQIDDVASGGPAEKAGLTGGDTITALNGTAVTSPAALTNAILQHKVGETVTVTYYDANGVKKTANVVLGSGPAQ